MTKLLRQRVLAEAAARWLAWTAGFVVLANCTALVLKALPDSGVAASVGLGAAVAFTWVVVGAQVLKVISVTLKALISNPD